MVRPVELAVMAMLPAAVIEMLLDKLTIPP
jgi:hypothetical protein